MALEICSLKGPFQLACLANAYPLFSLCTSHFHCPISKDCETGFSDEPTKLCNLSSYLTTIMVANFHETNEQKRN